jgi:hypothetical protein
MIIITIIGIFLWNALTDIKIELRYMNTLKEKELKRFGNNVTL